MRQWEQKHERVFSDPAFARKYARRHNRIGKSFGSKISEELLFRGQNDGRLLDVGCGSGATILQIKKLLPNYDIKGLDLSEPLLDILRDKLNNQVPRSGIKVIKAAADAIPFEDNSFDSVLNINMAHIVKDPILMFREMLRVLNPGGFLYIADLHRTWLGIFEKEINSSFNIKEVKELIAKASLPKGKFSHDLLWWYYKT